VIIQISAAEIKAACEADGVDVVAIEIPNAIEIDKATCIKCSGDGVVDVDALKIKVAMEAAGFVHAKACTMLDAGEDFRSVPVPELIEEMMKELAE